jgi:hypothetical protein
VAVRVEPERPVFVGEPFRLVVRLGTPRDLSDFVTTFARDLDVPAVLSVPWSRASSGGARGVELEPEQPAERPRRLVVDGEVLSAREVDAADGRRAFELAWRCVARQPGPVDLAGIELQVDRARSFREDFFGTRVPEGIERITVVADPVPDVRVRPVPTEGRPRSYCGVVGPLAVTAALASDPERVELTIALRGSGVGPATDLPELGLAAAGFRELGRLREDDAESIVFRLALEARAGDEIPSLAFSSFDPVSEEFITSWTQAIPVAPRDAGAAERPTWPTSPRVDLDGLHGPFAPGVAEVIGRGRALAVFVACLPWLVAMLACAARMLWLALGRRSRADEIARRARSVREAAARGEEHATERAFAECVGGVLGAGAAVAYRPDLPGRLTAAGVAGEVARRAQAFLRARQAERFGSVGDSGEGRSGEDVGRPATAAAIARALGGRAGSGTAAFVAIGATLAVCVVLLVVSSTGRSAETPSGGAAALVEVPESARRLADRGLVAWQDGEFRTARNEFFAAVEQLGGSTNGARGHGSLGYGSLGYRAGARGHDSASGGTLTPPVSWRQARAAWLHAAGASAFRLDRYAEAAWCFRAAIASSEDGAAAAATAANLARTEERLGLAGTARAAAPSGGWSLGDLLRLVLSGTVGVLGLCAALRGLEIRRSAGARSAIAAGCVLFVAGFATEVRIAGTAPEPRGSGRDAVVLREVALRSTPAEGGAGVVDVRPGTPAEILRASDRWAEVRVRARGDEFVGWVPADSVLALTASGPTPRGDAAVVVTAASGRRAR